MERPGSHVRVTRERVRAVGQELYRTLAKDDVDLSMVRRLPQPSTLAFVSKPPGADVRYAFFKEQAADRSLTARRATLGATEGGS